MLGDLQNSFLAAQALYLLLWVTGGWAEAETEGKREKRKRKNRERK